MITKAQQFRDGVAFLMLSLEQAVFEHVAGFEETRMDMKNYYQNQVDTSVSFLIQTALQVSINNVFSGGADMNSWLCLENIANVIRNILPEQLSTMTNSCADSVCLDLTRPVLDAISLNDTAICSVDAICECVEGMSTCPSTEEALVATACVQNAANALCIDTIVEQGTAILSQVDQIINDAIVSIQTCESFVHISEITNNVKSQIETCRTWGGEESPR